MEKKPGISDFNMSISYLNRLNYIFYMMLENKLNRDLPKYSECLVILFTELTTQMELEEIKEKVKVLQSLKDQVNQAEHNKRNGFTKGTDPHLYWGLAKFEIFLRSIMKRAKLEIKYSEDPGAVLR